MDEMLLEIRKNLNLGDLKMIANKCKVSPQKVSKIFCGGVMNPDPKVIDCALRVANQNIETKKFIESQISKFKANG